jgi:TRAP-type C4-dicarboxylate transport system substrate-binding protein
MTASRPARTTPRLSRRRFVQAGAASASALTITGAPWIANAAVAEGKVFKLATLAPQNSSWMKAFQAAGREIKERTGGSLSYKLYGGGVMGDEGAMIRKMRTGQLDGAAVTSVGLGEIHKQLLMLQLPMVFRSVEELDRTRDKMSDKLNKLMADSNFRLLGWGDVGFGYFFSNTPVASPAELKQTKMWVWDVDPISKQVYRSAGVNAVPLSVPDVLPSLQTGVIDAFVNAPYAAIALQWYTKVKYVTNLKFNAVIGGSVVTQKAYDSITEQERQIVAEVSAKYHGQLLAQIRGDNKRAITTLQSKGITPVEPDAAAWKKLAEAVRKEMTGGHFDSALVNEMLSYV